MNATASEPMEDRTDPQEEERRPQGFWARLSAFLVRRAVIRSLVAALLIAVTLAGAGTYAAFTGLPPFGQDPDSLITMIYLDLVLLLMLAFALTRQVVALWSERRRGSAGSRLHVRLVGMFAALAAAPTVIVAVYSLLFFDLGLESWFSDRVRTAVSESQAVAEAYLEEHRKNIRTDVLRVARDLNKDALVLQSNQTLLNRVLDLQMRVRDLSEALIFEGPGRDVIARAGLTFTLEFEPIPQKAIRDAAEGEVVILTSDADDRVRAIIKLDNFIDTYLYVGRTVDARVLARIEQTRGAVRQFERLEGQRSDIQISFALTFVVVALLLLMTAIWVGLIIATQLSRPISVLIGATEKIREGDLDAKVPEQGGDDELALLSRAFNRMTAQLRSQRSELLEANRQIDDRRRFSEAVLSGVSAGVIGLDAQGRIDLPNRAASEQLAIELDARIGEAFVDVVPEMADLFAAVRDGHSIRPIEEQVKIERNGEIRTLLSRVVAERDGGAIRGYVVTFDDVSMLLNAQRKAAWADVARRIAHEIKNPLTPIQLSAERLKRKYLKEIESDPATFETCTDTIVRHVGDIGRMVDEFSSFARMPAPRMEESNLTDICRQAIFLQRNANSEIEYDFQAPSEPISVNCDSRQINQAVINLLQNAYDAIEGRMDSDPTPGHIRLRLSEEEGSDRRIVRVEIEDNGKGLPLSERDRLTEPYVTTRDKGTGLGLAIVKKIMEDHGGRLSLANSRENERGACVTLEFSCYDETGEGDTDDLDANRRNVNHGRKDSEEDGGKSEEAGGSDEPVRVNNGL